MPAMLRVSGPGAAWAVPDPRELALRLGRAEVVPAVPRAAADAGRYSPV